MNGPSCDRSRVASRNAVHVVGTGLGSAGRGMTAIHAPELLPNPPAHLVVGLTRPLSPGRPAPSASPPPPPKGHPVQAPGIRAPLARRREAQVKRWIRYHCKGACAVIRPGTGRSPAVQLQPPTSGERRSGDAASGWKPGSRVNPSRPRASAVRGPAGTSGIVAVWHSADVCPVLHYQPGAGGTMSPEVGEVPRHEARHERGVTTTRRPRELATGSSWTQKNTGPRGPVFWDWASRPVVNALGAHVLGCDAHRTVTTHGHHLLYPARTCERSVSVCRRRKRPRPCVKINTCRRPPSRCVGRSRHIA